MEFGKSLWSLSGIAFLSGKAFFAQRGGPVAGGKEEADGSY